MTASFFEERQEGKMQFEENGTDVKNDSIEELRIAFDEAHRDGKIRRISKVINGIHIPIGHRAKFDYRDEIFQQIDPDRPYYIRLDYSFGIEKQDDVIFVHTIDLVRVSKRLELTIYNIESRTKKIRQTYDFSFSDSYVEAFQNCASGWQDSVEMILKEVTLGAIFRIILNEPIQIFRLIKLPKIPFDAFVQLMIDVAYRGSREYREFVVLTTCHTLTKFDGLDPICLNCFKTNIVRLFVNESYSTFV